MKNKQYNVVLVLADQLNAGWMGCSGHNQAITPNIDKFSSEGIRFERAYCQNPICTPSRVSILSGQYCQNHGYYGLSGPAPQSDNLFRHFKRSGYRTAAFGKLHLPESPRNWIADDVDVFGDAYEDANGTFGCSDFLLGLEEKKLRHLEDSWHNPEEYGSGSIAMDAMPSKLPFNETMEMWCLRQSIEFIEAEPERPFCIQIAFQKPHHPLLPNQRFWDLYPEDLELPEKWDVTPDGRPPHFVQQWEEWKKYRGEFAREGEAYDDFVRRSWRGTLACVSQVDYVFGELIRALKTNDILENTIVVFGSDHGAYHGHYGMLEKAPGICSDAVCRVPMIWRVPGMSCAGTVNRQLVENVDLVPTLSALCGLPEFESADGVDIQHLLEGSEQKVREICVTENVHSKALIWGQWRFVHYQRDTLSKNDIGELYNMEDDPWERNNLYHDADHQSIVIECRRLLLEWLIKTRRTVTTQTSIRDPKLPSYTRGVRFKYPRCEDGFAPAPLQAHNRQDLNCMYQ